MPTVSDRARELQQHRGELGALFDKHRSESGGYDMPPEVLAEVRSRNAELDRLTDDYFQARDAEEIGRRNDEELARLSRVERLPFPGAPIGGPQDEPAGRSLGRLIVDSKAYRERMRGGGAGPVSVLDVDLKTLMSTTAGWDPEDTRTGKVLLAALQQPRVIDLVPRTTTGQSTVLYMSETTHTSGAAEAAEGSAYGESALAFTEQSSEVRKIGVALPVTDEMMEDTARMQDLIDNRLRFQIMKRLDSQILNGNGTAPNLRGVNNLAGINTQAKGTDPVFDAFQKGITLIQTNAFENPDAIVLHPADWQDIRLTRTADGLYILGNPGDDVPQRILGLPVVVTTHQPQNTGIIGAFRMHSELALRRGIEVQVTDSHSTFFTEGKKMIRADIRVALIFDRAAAFCTVTGI